MLNAETLELAKTIIGYAFAAYVIWVFFVGRCD